jgi:hypothetical protein
MFEDKVRRYTIIGKSEEIGEDKVHPFLYPSPSFNLRGGSNMYKDILNAVCHTHTTNKYITNSSK